MIAIPNTIEPEICTYIDGQRGCLIIEAALPGARRLDIRVKVNSRCLVLSATTDTFTYEKYLAFFDPVVPEKAHARFDHELLRIMIPLRG
jgi:HSP20 family molecular chaperone IbpA